MITPRLQRYFDEYHSFHTTRGNVMTHFVGIPLIMVTLLSLLSHLGSTDIEAVMRLDGGIVLWALSTLFYMTMDWKIGLPFSVVVFGAYVLGRAMPVSTAWVLFVFGWVAQYVGHLKYEKKSPAFYKNFEHLLIGPIWIFAKIIGYSKSQILKT